MRDRTRIKILDVATGMGVGALVGAIGSVLVSRVSPVDMAGMIAVMVMYATVGAFVGHIWRDI